MTDRLIVFACFVLPLFVAAGCAGKSNTMIPSASMEDKLTEIGRMYKDYSKDHKHPPRTLSDLDQAVYEAANTSGFAALRDGECVMLWGGKPPGVDAAKTVLAYEKSVPESGGLVLFQDGSVRPMTAAEFKSAPKAN